MVAPTRCQTPPYPLTRGTYRMLTAHMKAGHASHLGNTGSDYP